jgi:hypothetical protein
VRASEHSEHSLAPDLLFVEEAKFGVPVRRPHQLRPPHGRPSKSGIRDAVLSLDVAKNEMARACNASGIVPRARTTVTLAWRSASPFAEVAHAREGPSSSGDRSRLARGRGFSGPPAGLLPERRIRGGCIADSCACLVAMTLVAAATLAVAAPGSDAPCPACDPTKDAHPG